MLYIPEDHAAQLMQWLLTAIFLNVLALFFMRISVCFFVLRLLPPSKTWKSWPKALTYATLFVNFISTLINCLGFGLWCRPLAGLWNHQIKAKCYSYHVLVNIFRVSGGMFSSKWSTETPSDLSLIVLGALSDFSVALIPVFIVMGLQMDFRTKISISIVLGLGFLTAACSIAKVIVSINPDNPRSSNTNVGFLSTTEECFGIIIASLPALHQLFVRKRHASALPVYAKDGPSHQSSSTGGQKSLVRSKNKGSGRASMELQEMLMQDEQIPSKKNSESSTREEWISKKTEVHISASHRSQRDLRSKFNTRQSNHYGPNDDTFAPWANNKSLPAIPTDITDAR